VQLAELVLFDDVTLQRAKRVLADS